MLAKDVTLGMLFVIDNFFYLIINIRRRDDYNKFLFLGEDGETVAAEWHDDEVVPVFT